MRVAAISDIHGNLPALEAVLADIEREGVDEIVVGGDSVSWPWPAEVFDLLGSIGARMVRGNMIETMQQDYIRTARVKGLSESKVIFKHGLRASLTPVVTLIGLDLGALLGGAVITETVFNLQGVGQWAVSSVFQGDLPVVLAVTVVVAVAVTLMNLIVDIVYAILDPRVRLA